MFVPSPLKRYSPPFPAHAQAAKRTRFATFPDVLLVQLRRYYVAEDWTPRKMEVAVEMPARLSLEAWRSTGVKVSTLGEKCRVELPMQELQRRFPPLRLGRPEPISSSALSPSGR